MVSADGVPDFVGKDIDAIKNNPDYTNRFEFIVKEDYNEEYPNKNIVYDQNPAKGTPMPNKGYVTLYVSQGFRNGFHAGIKGKYFGVCNEDADRK